MNTIFEPLSGPTFAEIEDLWADEGRGTLELDGLCEELLRTDGTIQKSIDPYRGGFAFFFSLNVRIIFKLFFPATVAQTFIPLILLFCTTKAEESQRRRNSPGVRTPAQSVYHSPQAPLTTPGAKTYGSGVDFFRQTPQQR